MKKKKEKKTRTVGCKRKHHLTSSLWSRCAWLYIYVCKFARPVGVGVCVWWGEIQQHYSYISQLCILTSLFYRNKHQFLISDTQVHRIDTIFSKLSGLLDLFKKYCYIFKPLGIAWKCLPIVFLTRINMMF